MWSEWTERLIDTAGVAGTGTGLSTPLKAAST